MKRNLTLLQENIYKSFVSDLRYTHETDKRDYIIGFVSISDPELSGRSHAEIANIVSEYFDTEEWPSPMPADTPSSWSILSEENAEEYMTTALCGGREYGNTKGIMSKHEALKIWETYIKIFSKNRTIYSVSIGDATYMQQDGVLVVDDSLASIFNVGNAL